MHNPYQPPQTNVVPADHIRKSVMLTVLLALIYPILMSLVDWS